MFFRSASFCASSVMNLSASLPVPPYGVNTRGLKEPCSISIVDFYRRTFNLYDHLIKNFVCINLYIHKGLPYIYTKIKI